MSARADAMAVADAVETSIREAYRLLGGIIDEANDAAGREFLAVGLLRHITRIDMQMIELRDYMQPLVRAHAPAAERGVRVKRSDRASVLGKAARRRARRAA